MLDRFEDFVSLMNTAYKGIQKIKSEQMGSIGLKGCYVMYLFYLGNSKEGLTAGELCEKCKEDKAAVSRNLKVLTEMGLVKNSEDSDKKYKLKIVLTKKGEEAFNEIKKMAMRAVDRYGSGLTDEERRIFYKALSVIVTNFDKENSGKQ